MYHNLLYTLLFTIAEIERYKDIVKY